MGETSLAKYQTDSGFYVGDRVELPDGRKGYIDRITLKGVNYSHYTDPSSDTKASVVRVVGGMLQDYGKWLDCQLTRIG